MTLRPEYSLGHSEYNAFLFASVGEEKTGLPLTVQTALIRLGLDPWQEAARLSDLPRDAAAQALAMAMARLPEGDWKAAALPEIAARLVSSLPGRSAPAIPPTETRRATKRTDGEKTTASTTMAIRGRTWLVWIALAAVLFVGVLALQGGTQFESAPGDGSAVQQQKQK